jgi:hypothetical protein
VKFKLVSNQVSGLYCKENGSNRCDLVAGGNSEFIDLAAAVAFYKLILFSSYVTPTVSSASKQFSISLDPKGAYVNKAGGRISIIESSIGTKYVDLQAFLSVHGITTYVDDVKRLTKQAELHNAYDDKMKLGVELVDPIDSTKKIVLAALGDDQIKFNALLSMLISHDYDIVQGSPEEGTYRNTPTPIADLSGNIHIYGAWQVKQLIDQYGMAIKDRWTKLKTYEAQINAATPSELDAITSFSF